VQRGGWFVLGVFIGLALFGLFSNGPISSATAKGTAGTFQVEYQRFERNGAATTLRLRLPAGPGGEASMLLGQAFVETFKIEAITPQPVEQRGSADGVHMTFLTVREGPLHVSLAVRPEAIGPVESEIGMAGEAPIRFTQFVYP
jgi:hypothetical protein